MMAGCSSSRARVPEAFNEHAGRACPVCFRGVHPRVTNPPSSAGVSTTTLRPSETVYDVATAESCLFDAPSSRRVVGTYPRREPFVRGAIARDRRFSRARNPSSTRLQLRLCIGSRQRYLERMDRLDRQADLTDEQRAWTVAHEALWRRAMTVASKHPGMDVSGVYHVLVNLKRSPEERLRRGLGRLRPDRR
jgi:hypothetical protein